MDNDDLRRICVSCGSKCKSCASNNCTSCPKDYYLLINNASDI
jgi:hypothetical protein